jgi:predicted nucleic acid-binding protein
MRVVLDANVLVSAIFFSGPPSRILSAWLEDKFELVVSAEILEGYRGTANRIGEK